MIENKELLGVAQTLGLAPHVVEKDYVLGWILAGISANPEIAGSWVFKGGTCLKKCYFETYRFSEDLDFTVMNEAHLDEAFLRRFFGDIAAWIYEMTGIEVPADQLRFEVYRNKRERLAGEGRVYYRGPIAPKGGNLPKIKLDLTTDELLALPAVSRPVVHPYSDEPEGGITVNCYAYEEVFAEKVRALGERARPRDLYDVINLFRHEEFQPAPSVILNVLQRKCDYKAIGIPTFESIKAFYSELAGDWATMLAHQLPALPSLESFWDALPEFFAWLAGGERPAVPPAYPLAAGEETIRQPIGTITGPGIFASALETIRFAGSNRLTVAIDYVKENGERGWREIEPYALRRTKADDIILHSHDIDKNDHRGFRVDRIRGAKVTGNSFVPRHAIELTPSGYQSIPDTERRAGLIARPSLSPPSRSPWGAAPQRSNKTRGFGTSGVTYVYQCPVCQKKFERKTRDGTLRAHKTPGGWDCSGRTGYLVDTKY